MNSAGYTQSIFPYNSLFAVSLFIPHKSSVFHKHVQGMHSLPLGQV